MENKLNVLSSRAGFNTALRHFKSVSFYSSEVQGGVNLADLINESIDNKEIDRFQVKSILNALLIDKFGYRCRSHNLEKTIEGSESVLNTVAKWGNLQLVVSYYHPQAGQYVINPKNKTSWDKVPGKKNRAGRQAEGSSCTGAQAENDAQILGTGHQ
jgi:hypothetical protein